MSRSYRHYSGRRYNMRNMKAYANRSIRKKINNVNYEVGNYAKYKRLFCSYDICDYTTFFSKSEAIADMTEKLITNRLYYLTYIQYMRHYKWK